MGPVCKEWRFFLATHVARSCRNVRRSSTPEPEATMRSPKWWNGSPKWWRISMCFFNVFFWMGNFITCWFLIIVIWYVLCIMRWNMNTWTKTKKYFWLMSWQPIWTKTFVKLVYVVYFLVPCVICWQTPLMVGCCCLLRWAWNHLGPQHEVQSNKGDKQIVTWEIPRRRLYTKHGFGPWLNAWLGSCPTVLLGHGPEIHITLTDGRLYT